jgi:hypothetical protein
MSVFNQALTNCISTNPSIRGTEPDVAARALINDIPVNTLRQASLVINA